MSKQIINLTRLFTIKEIQSIFFKITDKNNIQGIFIIENQYYRQKLIDYVLSRIDNRYMEIEIKEIPKEVNEIFPQCSLTEKIKIRHLLIVGMSIIANDLITENFTKLSC